MIENELIKYAKENEEEMLKVTLASYKASIETGFLHYVDTELKMVNEKAVMVLSVKECKSPINGEAIKLESDRKAEILSSMSKINEYFKGM